MLYINNKDIFLTINRWEREGGREREGEGGTEREREGEGGREEGGGEGRESGREGERGEREREGERGREGEREREISVYGISKSFEFIVYDLSGKAKGLEYTQGFKVYQEFRV